MRISKENEVKIKQLITAKATVAKIKGAVHFLNESNNPCTDKGVRNYLATLGYTAIRVTNFISDYYARLKEGELGVKEFKAIISGASANTIKHEKHYDNIRVLCNAIRNNALGNAALSLPSDKVQPAKMLKGGK